MGGNGNDGGEVVVFDLRILRRGLPGLDIPRAQQAAGRDGIPPAVCMGGRLSVFKERKAILVVEIRGRVLV